MISPSQAAEGGVGGWDVAFQQHSGCPSCQDTSQGRCSLEALQPSDCSRQPGRKSLTGKTLINISVALLKSSGGEGRAASAELSLGRGGGFGGLCGPGEETLCLAGMREAAGLHGVWVSPVCPSACLSLGKAITTGLQHLDYLDGYSPEAEGSDSSTPWHMGGLFCRSSSPSDWDRLPALA